MRLSGQAGPVRLIVIGILWAAQSAGQFIITTVAGGAPPPTPSVATTASIGWPAGIAVDAAGNVYFASSNYCVFKLDKAGNLTLIAGNSRPGYSGDGGPAVSAQFRYSNRAGIAVDAAGNVYIPDTLNNRVRRVSSAGVVTTVAGTGAEGFSGDGGLATSARLSDPTSVALDAAGNLYIGDSGNSRVRRVSLSGVISTPPGASGLSLQFSLYVAVDGSGNLYVSDTNTVKRVSPSGAVVTVAGGSGTSADLIYPCGIAVDALGTLYIADTGRSRIRRMVGPDVFVTVAGTGEDGFNGDGGAATMARLDGPAGVAVDATGALYIADSYNYRIRRVSPAGMVPGTSTTAAGNGLAWYSGEGGPARSAQIEGYGVAVDNAGNIFFAEYRTHRVRRVSPEGVIVTVAGSGVSGYSGDGGSGTSATLYAPSGVAVDGTGNLYIADTGNHRVRRVSPAGIIETVAGGSAEGSAGDGGAATSAQLRYPESVTLDAAGNLYIGGDYRVRRVSPTGIITTWAGTGSYGYSGDAGRGSSARIGSAFGLAADSAGNLYIADASNHRIRRVSPDGIIDTVAGNGVDGYSGDGGLATSAALNHPTGVTVDAAGNIYIADNEDNRIRRVSPSGIITTVAGTGVFGYTGDGGPAGSAQMPGARSLATDLAGRVYCIVDSAIRRLATPAVCTSSATPAALTASPAGGLLSLTIQAGAGCPWSITGLADWITASATTGAGPSVVTLNVAANAAAPRAVTITAAGTAVTISQGSSGGACAYSISSADLGVAASGGTVVFSIRTDPGCAWSISGLPAWLTVSGSAQGAGSASLSLVAAVNSAGMRSASVSLGGVSVPVRQFDSSACGGSPSCVTRVLPHLAAGDEWTTSLFMINSATATSNFSATFYDDGGSTVALPFAGGGMLGTLSDSVPAQGRKDYEAGGISLPLQSGWGLLAAEKSVTGQAVFRRARPGGAYYEAAVPSSEGYSGFLIPFDASTFAPTGGPLYTGFAIANLNPNAEAHVICIARDQWGSVVPNAVTIPALKPSGHHANSHFPELTGKRGTLDCTADTLVAAIALRFIGTDAFSTLPVIAK